MELDYDTKKAVVGDLATGKMTPQYFQTLHGWSEDHASAVMDYLRNEYGIDEGASESGPEWRLSEKDRRELRELDPSV